MKRVPSRRARAISSSCCWPTVSSPARWSGSTSRPQTSRSCRASLRETAPLDGAEAGARLVVQEEILADAEFRNDRRFLVDACNTRPPFGSRRDIRGALAGEANLPGVRPIEAGEQADHRRFAGAVSAGERDGMARLDFQRDVVKSERGAVAAADGTRLHQRHRARLGRRRSA